jgi:enamine deaminase RidA (YjgF/YER057c/UK114 family)
LIIETKLKELGIKLPETEKPLGVYVPAVRVGALVFLSGTILMIEGKLKYKGKIGKELTVEQGYDAARICAINALAALKSEIDDLDQVERVVRTVGYVNCVEGFTKHPKIVNGASELLSEVFGNNGIGARLAIGISSLPEDSPVEIEIIFKLKKIQLGQV